MLTEPSEEWAEPPGSAEPRLRTTDVDQRYEKEEKVNGKRVNSKMSQRDNLLTF